MLQTAFGRVRLVGMLEGVSFLILLGIAMPLKYLADRPEAVLVVGWAHGVLFVLYAAVTFAAWGAGKITFRTVALAALAALLPGGPFFLDPYLRRLEQSQATSTTAAPSA